MAENKENNTKSKPTHLDDTKLRSDKENQTAVGLNREKVEDPTRCVGKMAEREEKTLEFWDQNKIFEKSLKQTEGKKEFVFYDGPPFANGLPHYGHILASLIKDAIPRYKTMQGFHVPRRWGWDCHGLPVENLVERDLNLPSKKAIEDYGIDKFNEASAKSVMKYADDWRKIVPRIGRWVDMKNDYRTMDTGYTESVWWSFKTLYDQGLIYEGFKSMHLCPHCETTLSNFEVTQGYKDTTDLSVTAKFKLKNPEKIGLNGDVYILAWTTTPWTLPGNMALAVGEDVDYLVATQTGQDGSFIVARERIGQVIKDGRFGDREIKGKELVGLEYEPLFDYYSNDGKLKNKENGWKVYPADFVTTEDGTGIVHIAPAFGEDDYQLSLKFNLPFVQHVGTNGIFKPEVKDFPNLSVKPKEDPTKTDVEVIKFLAHENKLFSKEKFTHSYPFCWRCDTPLINYATSSWFVKVTAIKDKLISVNKKVNWVPSDIRDGRFGKWLEGARDWAISRSRFWGAPLPVWRCATCGTVEVVESLDGLEEISVKSNNKFFVMRHGESTSNVGDIVCSSPDCNGLTESGIKQTEISAQKLKQHKIDVIITSPLNRTKDTAEIVRKSLGLPETAVIVDEAFHEIDFGVYNKKHISEYHEFFANSNDRFNQKPEGAESEADVKRRVGKRLFELDKQYEGKNILIVTHDTPAWLISASGLGLNQKETELLYDKSPFLKNSEVREVRLRTLPRNDNFEIDLHRPYIDNVNAKCKCGGNLKRVPEVFDCWYESGSMPFASNHYPFNKKGFNPGGLLHKGQNFPANFIAEGQDQTRGWFYTMLILAVALFDKSPYENVIVNGIVLAEDGQKMSKKLQNYPDPMAMINKYSMDALRVYLLGSPVVKAQDLCFSEKGVDEILKKVFNRLDNVLQFFLLYSSDLGLPATSYPRPTAMQSAGLGQLPASSNVLDQWILARLSETAEAMTKAFESYELDKAVRPIGDFVEDLSTWYLRRSRDRFKGENENDKKFAMQTTRFVLLEFSKLMAPIAPFFAEYLYRNVSGNNLANDVNKHKSVHLEKWPDLSKVKGLRSNILDEMTEVRKVVTLGLEARAKANIKVRQPLSELTFDIHGSTIKSKPEMLALIADEVNVKKVTWGEAGESEIWLNTEITPELKAEGNMRELVRAIQDLRKNKNLDPKVVVDLKIATDEVGQAFLKKFEKEISSTSNIKFGFAQVGENTPEISIDNLKFKLEI